MRRIVSIAALCLTAAFCLTAQITVPRGELVEGLKCQADPTQTYTLYLPSKLAADRQYPILLIYDPRGRATMAARIFEPAAEKYGWILISSNDTRSDGPPEPNVKALNALLPEIGRYPIDQRRVYMTGFSGGAMLAFVVAARNDGAVAGVIGVGGRLPEGWERGPVKFAHWGAAGNTDFNYTPMRQIDEFLQDVGAPHRFEVFEGRHQWLPQELAEDAVAWMELDAMRRGLRQRDAELIEQLWAKDVTGAKTLEADGDHFLVLERWKNIVSTFDGLHDVSSGTSRVKELEKDKVVREALKTHRKWDKWEEQMRRQLGIAVGMLRFEERPIPLGRLTAELRLDEINKHIAAGGYEALAAGRVFSSMYAQVSFYLSREFMNEGRYDRAALVLEVAEIMQPGSGFVLYNLACARARLGQKNEALTALSGAIDNGFSNARLMASDNDLASIRDEAEFMELLGRVKR